MNNRRSSVHARADIRGNALAPRLGAEATFTQKRNGVLVTVRAIGLPLDSPTGSFALRIEKEASCGGEGIGEPADRYDPRERAPGRSAAQLPPLICCGGEGYISVLTDRFTVRDIVGRTVVICAGSDGYRFPGAGAAGTMIACGEIRRAGAR